MHNISRDNWLKPPFNRKSFQHVKDLFPTSTLECGALPSSLLPSQPAEISSIHFQSMSGEYVSIEQMISSSYTDAFLILRDGTLIYEYYSNGMGADSLHLLNSISKTFLGMLTGILVEDGVIDLEQRVCAYAKHLEGTGLDQTTVQQALDMTSAVKFSEDYASPRADFWIETAVLGWRPDLFEEAGTNSLKEFASSRIDEEQRDGRGFHYRTLLTNVIAMVIEEATNNSVSALMEERLWQKLRPEHNANVVIDGDGFPYFGAGMSVSARDLVRFGNMLLNDGEVDGVQVVPAEWVRSTRSGSAEHRRQFAATDYSQLLPDWHYKNQTWACESKGLLVSIGIFGQKIYVHQPSGIVIVKLSTHTEPASDIFFADTFFALNALTEGLVG